MQYADYKNQASSEKITLAVLEPSKRLMGWTLHSGSVYSIPFSHSVIASIEDSGSTYTEVSALGDVTASKFYLDRDAGVLYLRTTGSDNPNGRFLVATFKLFFANVPTVLPHDLASGFEVYWAPTIASASQFGVEIDTVNQVGEAIEGSGTLTLLNDQDFWPANFDKLYFENKACRIYSYGRELDPSEAKLIFQGQVEKKSYSAKSVQFGLKDALSVLRSPVSLGTMEDLGLRTSADLAQARQRLVLGRVFGHLPINTDQVLDGYPITGTVSISTGAAALTGSGTTFLAELSPDDRIILNEVEYSIASVSSDTAATLTENYSASVNLSGASASIIPDQPKRWMNRTWHVAGHACREPETVCENGCSITRLIVEDTSDIFADDWIAVGTVGSHELVQIDSITGSRIINLKTSLATVPVMGTPITRPAVQNVRINDVPLVYWTDYTFDASTGELELRDTAESNSAPIRNLVSSLSFADGSRTVTGSGLKSVIKPGYMVGVVGNAVFFEVLSVDSDTQLTLRTAASFTDTDTGRYKSLIYNPSEDVLSLDLLGKTDDGTTTGILLKTAPRIVQSILTDLGMGSRLDTDSFDDANDMASMHLGLVVPTEFGNTSAPTYRDVINKVNKSVFGSLIQTSDFQLAYNVLRPRKPSTALYLSESDILDISFESTAEQMVKTSIVEYRPREHDYLSGKASFLTQQKTSSVANHIAKSGREKTFSTCLVEESDAEIVANRWAFLLEQGAGRATITTKLQAIELDVGSVVEISHRKFFERIGMSESTRLMLVEAVKKSGTDVKIEVVDLSGAFGRVAAWNSFTDDYASADARDRLYGGYFTDQYGLIDNDPDSFGLNVYW